MASRRILVVDDDKTVRDAYRGILSPVVGDFLEMGERLFSGPPPETGPPPLSYEVHEASDGEAAFRMVRHGLAMDRPFRVAFVDMKMPGMDGAETVARIWSLDPRVKVVIVTAYSDTPPHEIVEKVGRADLFYLQKPFNPQEIRQFAEALCSQWAFDRKREDALRKKDALRIESLVCMAGAVAHHLNNLLMGLGGNLDLLRMDLLGEKPSSPDMLCAYLDRAEEATGKLGRLGHHLLSYLGQRLNTAGLTDVSAETASFLSAPEGHMGPGVTVETRLSPNPPDIGIASDVFLEMLGEILANAREAMTGETGRVVVTTGVCGLDPTRWPHGFFPEAPAGEYVFVEVSDSGCGMDEDTLGRMFDPFFSTGFTGRGLGLAVVSGLAGIFGGWIGVSSRPGKGTVFRLGFPAVSSRGEI